MSHRTEQLASTIQRSLQTVLSRGLNDPRVRGLISVTKVSVSDDLANATVWVSVLPHEHEELTLHGLRHAAGHLQSQIAASIAARRLPRLSFRLDESFKKEAQMHAALAAARREGGRDAPPEAGAT